MRILIIYGTSEGQTRKISRFMEEVLQAEGHQVVIADATEEPPAPDAFDAVLVGSSIHAHKYHSAVKHYVQENLQNLNQMPTAFFSVCMAVAYDIEEEHREAHNIAMEFLDKTGWNTHEVIQIAGALKYTQYDYFKKLVMRMIAKKQGGATDTSSDYEYTDWKAVKTFALRFVENIPAKAS
ncbi:protoporphyrinogen oxidase [Muricauda sp. JGD-17]|uniref:Protoporphyrinogen oxidase n=1 Tax=Flagellimonas ochracea TaxID=2696472 RepID=A0A964TAK3_9FLAO|nr:flavodoxin domain-containing protein [Allomuricauda ochracea]NAY91307.1 protoporphyrinogen oxidase [Allomuricauda ochracea]